MGATEEYQTTAEGGNQSIAAVRTAIILSHVQANHTPQHSHSLCSCCLDNEQA